MRLVRSVTSKTFLRRTCKRLAQSLPVDHVEWQRLVLRICEAKDALPQPETQSRFARN